MHHTHLLTRVCPWRVGAAWLQKWEHAGGASVLEVFAEVVGQGDPLAAAEAYWKQLAATLQAGSGPTGVCMGGLGFGWV